MNWPKALGIVYVSVGFEFGCGVQRMGKPWEGERVYGVAVIVGLVGLVWDMCMVLAMVILQSSSR